MQKNIDNMIVFDARLKCPFGLLIYGMPLAGKSSFIKSLIDHRHRIFTETFDRIYYFYGEKSKTVIELENTYGRFVETIEDLPVEFDNFIEDGKKILMIFDDLMTEVVKSTAIVHLVTKKCQHKNVSWIITMQNAFHRGNERLSITRSAHYIVIFNSILDQGVPYNLASKIMPENRKAFLDIFKEAATKEPFTYLFIDGKITIPEARFRTGLTNTYQTAYVPTNKVQQRK